jgi:hypothetical protein
MATTESVTTTAMRLLEASINRASGRSSEKTGGEFVAKLRRHQDNPRYDACPGSRMKSIKITYRYQSTAYGFATPTTSSTTTVTTTL